MKACTMSAHEMLRQIAEAVEESEQILEDYDTGQRATIVNGVRLKTALMKLAQRIESDWIEN